MGQGRCTWSVTVGVVPPEAGRPARARGVLPLTRLRRWFNRPVNLLGSRRRTAACAAATVVTCALTAPVVLPSASAAVSPEVRYSDRNVVAGTTVKAVVKKSSRPAGTDLVLQRQYLDGWRTADKSPVRTKKGFVLKVPTNQFGEFPYRVVAKADNGDVVSKSGSSTVTVRPPYKPAGRKGQHVFAAKPRVRWDSCRSIRWTFNPKASPKKALRQVREGVKRVRLATGLDFVYVGKTNQKPNPYGNKVDGADMIIGWRTAKDFGPFSKHPGTVGMGGNKFYSGYQEADGSPVNLAVQGGVVLNASMKGRLSNGFGKGATWGEVIIHELGHVIGLAHPNADSQIMYYSVIGRNADWGAGDLAGFRRVGDTRGCVERAKGRATNRVGRFSMH
jgi:hypothetical protein